MKRFASVLALATVLVIAAVAPAAAGTRPDDRAVHGPVVAESATAASLTRPDDRAWRGVGVAPATVAPAAPTVDTHGFNWADAGVGAAAAALVVLLAAGAAFAVRRQRVPAT
jgi:hypothetical protein